jgi:hypothetical protein
MTIIDHPRVLYPEIEVQWDGPQPDRVGRNNPSETITRWEWDIDLTPEQEALFRDIVSGVGAGMGKTDYAAIKVPYTRLKNYYLNDTPTNAQSVQAIKDLIRVIRAMWREETT